MMEGELQEEQWELIAPLLPKHKRRGRPPAEDRRTLNGILWVLRSGARWKDLPPKYGSRSTCHWRLQEWQDQGVWEGIRLKFLSILDSQAKLDWSRAFLDGSFVPAKKGARLSLERQRQHRPPGDGR
jgi:hypothetical protein